MGIKNLEDLAGISNLEEFAENLGGIENL